MKKILLIPAYAYMSNPYFESMKNFLSNEYYFIYFFSKDSTNIRFKNDISYESIGYKFNKYIEINNQNVPWDRTIKEKEINCKDSTINLNNNDIKFNKKDNNIKKNKLNYTKNMVLFLKENIKDVENSFFYIFLKNIYKLLKRLYYKLLKRLYKLYKNFILFLKIYAYKKEFIGLIKANKPDIIVVNSDMTMSYRIIKKYFPNIPVSIMQPCFIDFRERPVKNLTLTQKKINFISRGLLFPKQQYYGLENKDDLLVLFHKNFKKFYFGKKDNVKILYNPYFVELHQTSKKIRYNKETKFLFYQKYNLDMKKRTVVIYMADYINMYGKEMQLFIENVYEKLVFTYYKEFNFIIKMHPRMGNNEFGKKLTNLDNVVIISNEINFKNIFLIAYGDINISINSNASLESLVVGMTTINFLPLNLKNKEVLKELSKFGAFEAYTFDDISKILKDSLSKDNYLNEDLIKKHNLVPNSVNQYIDELKYLFNELLSK